MRSLVLALILFVFALAALVPPALGGNGRGAPKVYIDCGWCGDDYLREEIDYLNHVRERHEAQVHVMATSQRSGGGGREFTVTFTGREDFAGLSDTLRVSTLQDDTRDEIRERLVHAIELGLVRYLARSDLAERCTVDVEIPAGEEEAELVDPWNSWVFRLSAHGGLSGQKSYESVNIWNSLSAERVTEDWKFELSLSGSYSESSYDLGDGDLLTSITRSHHAYQELVKSLGEHWSIGETSFAYASTYENLDFLLRIAPAIEYNIFPYSESSRRALTLRYWIGGGVHDYVEETIYDKTRESVFLEGLEIELDLVKPWGSIGFDVEGRHYFHDASLNKLLTRGSISLNLVEGLSLNLSGRYAMIHDQLSLAKGEATDEEVLLHRRQLETSYSYYFSAGLSYSFGSIYNNVVNPRF